MTATAALPIAGYDSLRIIDILPRLTGLTASQLAAIERHELGHKYRTTLLARLDALLRAAPAPETVEYVDVTDNDCLSGYPPTHTIESVSVTAAVIDLSSCAAHDPRLWQTLLVPVPREHSDVESSKRRWFRRTA